MATKTVHGYYRFTDIFFEWSRVVTPLQDVRHLKAFIAYDALVHRSHPLASQKGGVELWHGTLPNGETRLMFTSAQVEYIRYWLDAMNLTTNPLPIPSSDYLVTRNDLLHTSPVVYRSGPELKKAIKTIDKNNKKLRGVTTLLSTRRLSFDRVRVFWGAKRGAWCAIDFESWDRDHSVITEFGYSFVKWNGEEQVAEKGHLIVKEYRSYYNTYVPNHRDKYTFGQSEEVDRPTFKRRICDLITTLSTDQPLYLIFHDYSQDLQYLNSKAIQAPLDKITPVLPTTTPHDGIYIVDTKELFNALEGEGKHRVGRSLDRVCKLLGIHTSYLHNAGNDAHYTLLAALEMASGDPVDMQREKRWPNSTDTTGPGGQGVRVQFAPERSDSSDDDDDDDMEGIFGRSGGGYDPKTGILREAMSGEVKMEL